MNRPIEYLVARSVDPFIDEKERKKYSDELCSRIGNEFEGPYITMKFLSYRLLSPDQTEALNTLKVMDTSVRKCGSKVAIEVGKYKFLNQFIRLLSPKYQGVETSTEVKEKAIQLLFTWKQSMKNAEKLQQVYSMLKDQCIIAQDPIFEEYVPQVPRTPPRLASFEDEEKAQLLDELLKSKNPNDLQAANRLIKSMVRSDEQKMLKSLEKRQVMDTAKNYAQLLQEMLRKTVDQANDIFDVDSEYSAEDLTVITEMQQWLLSTRPTLFRYASEAAEAQDESLGDILVLNDSINKAIQLYNDRIQLMQTNSVHSINMDPQLPENGLPVSAKNDTSSASYNDDVDLLSILTPVTNRKQYTIHQEAPSETNHLDDIFDACSYPTPSTTKHNSGSIINDLESLRFDLPNTSKTVTFQTDKFRLEDTPSSLSELSISTNEMPCVYVNEPLVKAILYPAFYANAKNPNIKYYVSVISTTNPNPIKNISLKINTLSDQILTKLLLASISTLQPFHPLHPTPTVSQILMIMPTEKNIQNIELSYELVYESPHHHRHHGKFRLD